MQTRPNTAPFAALDQALAAGRQRWPEVRVTHEMLGAHVTAAGVSEESLHTMGADLVLAAGCLAGLPEAVARFELSVLDQLPRWLARLRPTDDELSEIKQRLRVKVLVGPPPRIARYRGEAPLAVWVRISAIRLALDMRASQSDTVGADLEMLELLLAPDADAVPTPGWGQHGAAVREALDEALTTLPPRDRTLLRMHILDGMTIDHLGLTFHVHRATAARWLVAIRRRLLEHVSQRLKLDLGVRSSELGSVYRAALAQVSLSMSRIFARE